MEVHGNIKSLKKAIEQDYLGKAREINRHKNAQIRDIRQALDNDIYALESELRQKLDSKARETNAMVLNEQKLTAKMQFEEAREQMVQEVLGKAREDFPILMKSKKYIDFVKKNVPKNAEVFGNPFFKKHFKNLKVEKEMSGVKFIKGPIIYDLSLEALLEAREFSARGKLIEELW